MEARISDIMGKTGKRILRAIVAGERDPERLASFRDSRIKPRADTLAAGLQGTWRDERLFTLEQAMQRYDFLELQIEDCEARIVAEIEEFTPTDDPPDGSTPSRLTLWVIESRSSRGSGVDGLFAREAMFVAKALEYTLRRVVLLTVNRSVLLQNTVDDIREGGQFRAFRWLASPISRRFRMPQHLPHRLARNAKPTCRLSLAQTINMAGQPNAQI